MTLPAPLRRLSLTVHVIASVGWLGAVAAALGLALVGLTSDDAATVRSAYIALSPLASAVLVPLSIASLLSGLVQALGTTWGLVRHYWVIFKLVINLVASVVLVLYTQTLEVLADSAMQAPPDAALSTLRSVSPVLHGVAALLLLVVAAALSVFKPRGVTPYGWRRRVEQRRRPAPDSLDRV